MWKAHWVSGKGIFCSFYLFVCYYFYYYYLFACFFYMYLFISVIVADCIFSINLFLERKKKSKKKKKFKQSDEIFRRVGLSWSNIYFKIRLHKILVKFPLLKKSTLTSNYFKSNFKLIKKVSKANVNIFDGKKNFFLITFYPCLDNFV